MPVMKLMNIKISEMRRQKKGIKKLQRYLHNRMQYRSRYQYIIYICIITPVMRANIQYFSKNCAIFLTNINLNVIVNFIKEKYSTNNYVPNFCVFQYFPIITVTFFLK